MNQLQQLTLAGVAASGGSLAALSGVLHAFALWTRHLEVSSLLFLPVKCTRMREVHGTSTACLQEAMMADGSSVVRTLINAPPRSSLTVVTFASSAAHPRRELHVTSGWRGTPAT